MKPKSIMLRGKSHRKRQIWHDLTYMWNLFKKNYRKKPYRNMKQTGDCQGMGLRNVSSWSVDTNFQLQDE